MVQPSFATQLEQWHRPRRHRRTARVVARFAWSVPLFVKNNTDYVDTGELRICIIVRKNILNLYLWRYNRIELKVKFDLFGAAFF